MEFTSIISTLGISGILGALVFLTSLIVELTKEIPGIKRIPTKLWAIIVAEVVCILAMGIAVAVTATPMQWYFFPLAIIGALVIAYVSIYGWDTMKELWDKFKPKAQ